MELIDSGPLLGDWRALRERIAADGYVFVRRLLEPAMVREVGRVGLGHLEAAGWLGSVRAVRMRDALRDPGYARVLADPGFNRIPFTAELQTLMGQILGPGGFCYPFKLPRIVYPASLVPRQPGNFVHKDYGAVQDMFTCWVPLGAVPQALGGLAVEAGSQVTSTVRPRPLDALPAGWATVDYEPGDVLVFHCMTTHAALPNRSDRIRFSAEYRWQLADQPAPRRLVIGPRGHEIGSRLFARTSWWHSVAGGLTLFDDHEGSPMLPAAPSRFVPAGAVAAV
jgi:hypothetical protein